MKIFVDGLFYKGSGIGRYYESLLKGLVKRGIMVYTCVPKQLKGSFEIDFKQYLKNIIPIYVNYERFSIKAFWEQGKILKNLEKEVSLFHFPHINLPLYVPKNLIVTIHDLRLFTEFRDRNYFKKKIYEWYFKRAIKNAKKLISISETTSREIIDYYPKCEHKIKVIYEYVDDKFFYKLKEEQNNKRIIKDNYLLFIGNRKKHKNLGNLIKAFKIVKKKYPELKLVIAGKKLNKTDEVDILKKELCLENEVLEFMSPSDNKIINFYSNAELFILPSFYEGFGLPPLEAMALGTPVIVSDIPALREICGDAALFINPYHIEDIAKGILNLLGNDELKTNLIQKGFERIKFFNKKKIIQEYINFYQSFI